jgi:hypothetical protein
LEYIQALSGNGKKRPPAYIAPPESDVFFEERGIDFR